MRWYGQIAVLAVLGAAGYGGWYAHKEGHLAKVPVIGDYAAKLAPKKPEPATAGAGGARQLPPPAVDVDVVRTGRIVETREAVGTVRAFESITVTAKVMGTIQEIGFQEGQKVKAGDILLKLDSDERRADIEAAVAESRRATAQRDEIRTRLERAQALRRSGSGTEAQVDDLTAQVRTLESAIASAEARRKGAEARMEDLIIRAPFAGRLGTRAVSLGAYISPGTKITTLDDLDRVRLDFSVPENLLGRLKTGQSVRAISAAFADRTFSGKVSIIDPRVDPMTRTVRLTAEFDNPDETLKPGMFLAATLEVLTRDNAVLAQEEAIVNEGLRQILYVVKDDKIERRVIRIGQRQEGRVEVLEGLQPGETIVVRGVQRVRPGQTVNPKPISGAEQAPTATRPPSAPAAAGPAAGARPPQAPPPVGAAAAAERRG